MTNQDGYPISGQSDRYGEKYEFYFSFDMGEFKNYMGPFKNGMRKQVLVRSKDKGQKWCGWIKLWDEYGRIYARRDGCPVKMWGHLDVIGRWYVGDTIEESNCKCKQFQAKFILSQGMLERRVHLRVIIFPKYPL